MSTCVILFTIHVFFFFHFLFITHVIHLCSLTGETWWSSLLKQVVGEHSLEFISQTGGQGVLGQVH